jgi:general secretion pathway protein L
MTTLRIRLAAPASPDHANAWALFDAAGACVRSGVDRPGAWPAADRIEVVLAASQVRIASVALPPMPPSRIAGAVGFALEDQLAGPVAAHHLATSMQAPDGRVRVVIVAGSLVAGIAGNRGAVARIIAEPDLAQPLAGWRWCASKDDDGGFVRRVDGSAFPVGAPPGDGAVPTEIARALAQARRDGIIPPHVRVDAAFPDDTFARWQHETGVAFLRGTPWRWEMAPPAAFSAAIDVLPAAPAAESAAARRNVGRMFAPALLLAGATLALHVVAGAGEWASLRFDAWRDAREWKALALAAGVPSDAASTPPSARAALSHRYAELRHARGLPAPNDALPLLARAAPALAVLPPGSVKSAAYADGHWTLDVARADTPALRDFDARMRGAGLPVLVATSSTGTRMRFGDP